jgi:hypothetical protein
MRNFTDDIAGLRERLTAAERYLRVAELRRRQPQLEAEISRPDLWDDAEVARKVQTEMSEVNSDIDLFDALSSRLEDIGTLFELGVEEADDSVEAEINDLLATATSEFDKLELRALFTGEHDEKDAVCLVKSGMGGTDAQDWAEMLLRMYRRWAERRGFVFEIDAVSEGNEAGISTCEFTVKGRYAYGLLRAEHGVHRQRDRDRREGVAHRRVPLLGLGWSARQQDRFGSAAHAPSHRLGGGVSERAQPAPEQGSSDEDPQGEDPRSRTEEARPGDLLDRRGRERRELR